MPAKMTAERAMRLVLAAARKGREAMARRLSGPGGRDYAGEDELEELDQALVVCEKGLELTKRKK